MSTTPEAALAVAEQTSCPYARRALVVADRIVPEEDTTIESLVWSRLGRYTDNELLAYPDGLLLEFHNSILGANQPIAGEDVSSPASQLRAVSAQFNKLVRYFVASEFGPEHQDDVELLRGVPSFKIRVNKVGFFAIVFSSLYPENHPRHVLAEDRSVLFAQPQSSFDAHIPEKRKWVAQEAVRRAFEKDGRPYIKQGGRAALMIMGLDPLQPRDMEANPWWSMPVPDPR